jgi:hypothetical protein
MSKLERLWLIALGAFYLVVLLAVTRDSAWDLPQFDEISYLELADGAGGPSAAQAIAGSLGYVALLSAVRALSQHFAAVVAVNLALLYAGVLASWRVARRFAGATESMVGATLLGVAAPPLIYALHALPDVLVLAAVAACMWAWLRAGERATRSRYAVAWLLLTAAVLARPVAFLVVPWCVWQHGRARRVGEAAVMLAMLGAAHLPLFYRNAAAGDAVPVASSGAVNFWIGNGQGADGDWRPLPAQPMGARVEDLMAHAQRISGTATPAAARAYWVERAWSEVADQPVVWARLLGRKLLQTFQARELVDNRDPSLELGHSTIVARAGLPLWLLLTGGLVGLGLSTQAVLRSVWPWLGVGIATCVGFVALGRYRLVILPPLVVGAAYLLTLLRETARQRQYGRLMGVLFAAGVVAAVTTRVRQPPPSAAAWHARAVALHRAGRVVQALPAYAQARAGAQATNAAPGERFAIASSHGLALLEVGRRELAREAYLDARETLRLAGQCSQLTQLDNFLESRLLEVPRVGSCE